MKKITLLLVFLLVGTAASGGYGYYALVLDDSDDSDSSGDKGEGSAPIARINPSNPKIQKNETIQFTASDSTDSDGDELSFSWKFEDDKRDFKGETVERNYPESGQFSVILTVTDSTDLESTAETIVNVVEDYHAEEEGDVEAGESEDIQFPIKSGAVELVITWDLEDNQQSIIPVGGNQDPSSVNLFLTDSEGNSLENETGVGPGEGSWKIDSERLEPTGSYDFTIEGEEGDMHYDITIDVSY